MTIIKPLDIIIDDRARNGTWCTAPYHNHPKGCPNYGNRKSCPPFVKKFSEMVQEPFYLVIEEFDLGKHIQKMKNKHVDWTERQCKNVLYWQKGVVSRLKKKAYDLANKLGEDYIVLEVPEANGVDVFTTCKKAGILLDRNPKKIVKKVMIVGKKKNS